MRNATKSTGTQSTAGSSYNLRGKQAATTTTQNVTKSKRTNKTPSMTSVKMSKRINKTPSVTSAKVDTVEVLQRRPAATPTKQNVTKSKRTNKIPSVTSVKVSKRTNKTPSVTSAKVDTVEVLQRRPAATPTKQNVTKSKRTNKTPSMTSVVPTTPVILVERLSKRLEKLYTKKNIDKFEDKRKKVNSTPQKPTRVLRKRNDAVSNKYKDYTLNSPLCTKNSPNPLAVYEFEFDPSDEPAKKLNRKRKYESESSGDDDNDMKDILKKIRKEKRVIDKEIQERVKKLTQIIEPPDFSDNSVEMMSLSDTPDSLDPLLIDPSIQARNIVEELTKSFIEDLSDEETNSFSPGKVKILSNIVVRKPKSYKNKNKIFNSTTYDLKPSKPWRIDVLAIRRTPHIFTYKDKSFTPRYEPEIRFTLSDSNVQLIEKSHDTNQENNKATFQTSILNFVQVSKPKIIENKLSGLFNDLPKKPVLSPRKILGEINIVQSTPLKPFTNHILKSPNISLIKPKRKASDGMFGFSYFSDEDENKENVQKGPRRSPKKLKSKNANAVVEIVKESVQINDTDDEEGKIATTPDENENKENVRKSPRRSPKKLKYKPANPVIEIVKQRVQINDTDEEAETVATVPEPEMSAIPVDSYVSIALFKDVENDVLQKSTRKYVRKNAKRRRLPSVDSVSNGEESESEEPTKKKKKKKDVRTKEEEKEIDRLAAHYNSMFAEMSDYPLIIE